MLDPMPPPHKDEGHRGMFTLPPNPTEEQIARVRLRTLRTVWAVVLVMAICVVFLAGTIGVLHFSLKEANEDARAAKAASDKSTEQILINQQNGYKTRALLCTQLILDGVDIRQQEPCNDDEIFKYLNVQSIEDIRYGQLRDLCEVIQSLGASPPDSCIALLVSNPPTEDTVP